MKRRYLITGAQGLVGRYLTARILELEKGAQVLGIGRSQRTDGFFTHAISIDGGQRYAIRITPHLDIARHRASFPVPNITTMAPAMNRAFNF